MLLNSTKSLYSVKRTIKIITFLRKRARPIRSNYEMKLEKDYIFTKGGISVLIIKNIKNQKISKKYVGHILVDDESSFEINSFSI